MSKEKVRQLNPKGPIEETPLQLSQLQNQLQKDNPELPDAWPILLKLTSEIGSLADVLHSPLGATNKVVVKNRLADILIIVCNIANGANYAIPDLHQTMRFHGPHGLKRASSSAIQGLLGGVGIMFRNPEAGAEAIGKIIQSIATMAEAIGLEYTDIISHALLSNKKS